MLADDDRPDEAAGGLFYEPDRILLRDFMIGCIRSALHQIGGMVDEPAKLKLGEKKRDSALAM